MSDFDEFMKQNEGTAEEPSADDLEIGNGKTKSLVQQMKDKLGYDGSDGHNMCLLELLDEIVEILDRESRDVRNMRSYLLAWKRARVEKTVVDQSEKKD